MILNTRLTGALDDNELLYVGVKSKRSYYYVELIFKKSANSYISIARFSRFF